MHPSLSQTSTFSKEHEFLSEEALGVRCRGAGWAGELLVETQLPSLLGARDALRQGWRGNQE